MAAVQRVLIVGAGIAGLTAATALRRQGIEVRVLEIKSDVRQQPGVGLSLQGNSLAALGRIGLSAPVLRVSVAGTYLNIRRPDGALIAHQPLMPMGGPGYPGTAGISRSKLHQILLDNAIEAGAVLSLGVTAESVEDRGDRVSVRLSDGSTGDWDLVVGADGLYSKMRKQLFPGIEPRPLAQAVWRAGVRRMPGNYTTEMHFGGPFGIVGVCPVSESDTYLYIVETAEVGTWQDEARMAQVMTDKLVSYTSPFVRHAVDQLHESTNISYRPLEAILVPETWHRGRMMIIGDAAHAGPPVLAQGAAMGIEDAVVLAEELGRDVQLEQALQTFMQRRLPRASMVVNNSVQLCEWEVKHEATPQRVGEVMAQSQMALCAPF